MLIHELLSAQARRTPEVVALISTEKCYTYRELDRRTTLLASRLREAGVRPEVVVGCWSHRSVTTVVQVLSVLKAGGAYLLLDPHLPKDRLRYMIDDADPMHILCEAPAPTAVAGRRSQLTMDSGTTTLVEVPAVDVTDDNLAYVAYTSGSTGRPKGVLITHAAVSNHAQAFRDQFDLGPGDRLPLMAPVAFDMATEEMLPPLISGCTLIDAPDHCTSMAQFTEDVLANSYTILNVPAPLWHQWSTYLHESGIAVPPTLRLLIAGSDKIYTSKLDEWRSLPGAAKVWWVAAYGVTEATVTSLLYLTAAQDDLTDEPLVPIGLPLANVTAWIAATEGEPKHPCESGELHIGGVGIARGYLNLPARTSAQFAHGPDGTRAYRTGDLVRRREDGNLVWLGRQDSQIKISGLRIEPAEIEAVIHEYPHAGEAIVVFRAPARPGDGGRLVAYVAALNGVRLDTAALTTYLADRLHPLMVPHDIVVLDRIPLNANGKIDRKTLELLALEQAS